MNFVKHFDAIAKKFERFLAGGAVSDPLYISNRTTGQKIRMALQVGVPAITAAALIVFALNTYFDRRTASGDAAFTTKENSSAVTANLLPHIEKTFTTGEYSRDIELVQAGVGADGGRSVSGTIRNKTDHLVRNAEVVFYVVNVDGSQVGLLAVQVQNIAPKATATFKAPLKQPDADSVAVSEIHSR